MGGLPGPGIIGGPPPMHPGMGPGSPSPDMGPGLGMTGGLLPGAFVFLRGPSNLPGPPGLSTRILQLALLPPSMELAFQVLLIRSVRRSLSISLEKYHPRGLNA